MTDYHNTTLVDAPPEELFAFLSDVDNLPRYFARMQSAKRVGDGNAVQTQAKLPDGQVVEGEAWFDVDESAKQLSWGSEGPHDYHGQLTVSASDGGSQVHVVISTARVESDEVQNGVDQTVTTIKQLVEDRSTVG